MVSERELSEEGNRLSIHGRKVDVIGFAFDRDDIPEIRRLCSTGELPAPWCAAVRRWARGTREFLVMYGRADAYGDGAPSVIATDSERDFELSIYQAISVVRGCVFRWITFLRPAHVNQLRLALYVDNDLAGHC